MASIRILRSAMMMTVQDAGRQGLLRYGVSGSGAMDREAMLVANALVGNPADTALLEFAQFGGSLVLDEDRLIAACGDLQDLRIGGARVQAWQSHWLRAGQELSLGAMRETVWGYLAIAGGIDTAPILGSRATHLRTRLGGLEGRVLAQGDTLPLDPAPPAAPTRRLTRPWRSRTGPIHVVMGPQGDRFSPEVVHSFLTAPFHAGQKRDRMAMMVEGQPLPAAGGHDIVSDGTVAGSIQVPGSGQPIVLMADRQTTGGYPKIATVISADLARLAQMPGGRAFRFQAISVAQAEDMAIARAEALSQTLAGLETCPA